MIWNANQRRAAREILAREVKNYESMFSSSCSEISASSASQFLAVLSFAEKLGIISPSERARFSDSAVVLSGLCA